MVWKIFAPNYVFEALVLLVTDVAVVLSAAFFLRVFDTVAKSVESLQT